MTGRKGADPIDWPSWVPLASAGVAFVTAAVAVSQRWEQTDARVPAVLFALLATSPHLLEAAGYSWRRLTLPAELIAPPVLLGTVLLIQIPAQIDVAPFLLVFMTAEVTSRSERRWASLLVLAASCGVMIGVEAFGDYDGSFVWINGIVFGWFGGFMIQSLLQSAARLRRTQDDLAARSAAEERQRIAREVHDVIAHSMSVTMLHLSAARMALERERTGDALEALREAEDQGRRSLGEIRRTVGLLGSDDAAAPPQPSAADLEELVAGFRSAGLDIDLVVDGDVGAMSDAAGLNLYRIVQESLANVAKHAPGARASVDLRVDGDSVRLVVRNTVNGSAPPASDGSGLRGMSERAALLGGTLSAAPSGGEWVVRVDAPVR